MDMLSIRHAFEDKVRKIGGKVLGAGCLMVPPYTMDFSFVLEGIEYSVLVLPKEKRLHTDNSSSDLSKEEDNAA
jgi:hypothetical protein